MKRDCSTRPADGGGKGMQVQANVAAVPQTQTPAPDGGSQGSEKDAALAERLKELEDWRERVKDVQKFQDDGHPTNLERAARIVLSSVAQGKAFSPFR